MKFSRIWVAFGCLAFLLIAGRLNAQSSEGSADSGGSSITPSGSSSTGAPSPAPNPLGGTAQPPSGSEPGAATAKPPEQAVAPIKLPGGYGGAIPSILTPGEGRFAQPPIRFSLSLSQGYDDNVFSAPDHPVPNPQLYSFSTKEESVFSGYQRGGGGIKIPIYVPVVILVKTPIPITQPQPHLGSPVTRANLSFQTQAAKARTVYTLDLGLGVTDYWSRPGTQLEYNGSAGFAYYFKLTPRSNFTATGNASTSSQPDFGNLYGPSTQTAGQYVSANFKMDLSYQASPRISTDVSYNLDTTLYQQATEQTGNLFNNTVGAQAHYLVSPRVTAVLDYRVSEISYAQSASSDSTELFLLFGGDLDLSPRIHLTFRTGAQSKVYSSAGSAGLSSPYFESGLSYIYGRGSSLNWTTRYGFGESPSKDSSQKTVSFRTAIAVNQVLTARINATASLNFNQITTSSTLVQSTVATNQDQTSLSLGLNYVVNPHLSFNLSYSFTESLSDPKTSDYTRNQTFLGANYSF